MRNLLYIVVIVVSLIVIVAALTGGGGSSSSGIPKPTPEQRQSAIGFVEGYVGIGHVTRYDCQSGDVFVTPTAWAGFDAAFRHRFASTFVAACDGIAIRIIDAESGLQVAHMGPLGYRED